MGFMSHGIKGEVRPEQKWDYIGLNDFKSQSCFTPIAYAYLYFSLGLSIAVYAVDTFTAVNLLVFDRWSSEIAPTQLISFTASKWIFSICIILSVINLAYEHIRAMRIMRRGSVAECYLDNLAVRLESVRLGKGQGWKRFLVFAELTKSKKGAEYIALFTYFSFQSWIRVLLCSGPRQVVNALTLLSVYNAQLSVTGEDVGNTLLQFFDKIRILAEGNYREAVILSGMIFTLVIWVFSFLSLLLAFLFFLFFLWGYIPRSDGGLSGYCSRKINKRLMKIVTSKVNTALEEEERRRKKAELKAAKKKGELPPTELTATIPNVGEATLPSSSPYGNNNTYGGSTDKLPAMPNVMLQRNDTMATLPPYSSRPGTAAGGGPNNNSSFELNSMDQKPRPMMPPTRSGTMASMATMNTMSSRPMPTRSGTMASTSTLAAPTPVNPSYSTRAPLLGYAAEPGRSSSPTPTLPEMDGSRPGTQNGPGGPGGPMSPYGQLNRTNTGASNMSYGRNNSRNDSFSSNQYPNQYPDEMPPMPQMPQPVRSPAGPPAGPGGYGYNNGVLNDNRPPTAGSYATNGRNNSQSGSQDFGYGGYNNGNNINTNGRNNSLSSNGPRFAAYRPDDNNGTGRASPAPSARSYGPGSGPVLPNGPGQGRDPGMMSPMRSATNPYPVSPRTYGGNGNGNGNGSPYGPPQRNMTAPMPQLGGQNQNSNGGFGHGRQISEESSYSSYFERPTTSSSQRPPGAGNVSSGYAPPRGPQGYGNNGSGNAGAWNNDVEAQRGGRY
ncbi:Potassium transporter [Sporothrix bragantina]|uniref:Potassium transporter n=1 Tax=Sporothrix bragantina TaxID=671064 RepID=A0ABP0B3U3_9PEZI